MLFLADLTTVLKFSDLNVILHIATKLACLKGHCHGLTCAEAFSLAGLKKISFWDKYVYDLPTTLSCIPLCHHTFFSLPSCSFFPPYPEFTSRRHVENASVQLENIRLTFSSFGSDARACQPVTVFL